MKIIIVLLSVLCITFAIDDSKWDEFKKTYNKTYKDADDEKYRRELYEKSIQIIEEHNKKYENGQVTWKMAENMYTDMTADEVMQLHTGLTIAEFNLKAQAGQPPINQSKIKDESNAGNSSTVSTSIVMMLIFVIARNYF
uniref:CSON012901 protein n=1 Tax=Culicoides sonorensis TaxID=179676 RepID=A0A336N382_CULSO